MSGSIRRGVWSFFAVLAVLCVLCLGQTARADDTGLAGYDIHTFRPVFDGLGLFTTNRTPTLKAGQPHVGFVSNVANRILVAQPAGGAEREIIRYLWSNDLLLAVGLTDFVTLGIDVPFDVGWGENFNTAQKINYYGMGDLRISGKLRVLEDDRWWPGVAMIPTLYLPTGDEAKFTGESHVESGVVFAMDKNFWRISSAVTVGYRFVNPKTVLGHKIDDRLTFSGGIELPLPFTDGTWSVLGESFGSFVPKKIVSFTFPIEAVGGLRKRFASGLQVEAGAGAKLLPAEANPQARFFAGVGYTYGPLPRIRKFVEHNLPLEILAPVRPLTQPIEYVIYFDEGRSYVSRARYHAMMEEIADRLVPDRNLRIRVETFASASGPASQNRDLTARRGADIHRYLLGLNVRAGQIEIVPRGETYMQIGDYETPEGKALNRRAMMSLYSD